MKITSEWKLIIFFSNGYWIFMYKTCWNIGLRSSFKDATSIFTSFHSDLRYQSLVWPQFFEHIFVDCSLIKALITAATAWIWSLSTLLRFKTLFSALASLIVEIFRRYAFRAIHTVLPQLRCYRSRPFFLLLPRGKIKVYYSI